VSNCETLESDPKVTLCKDPSSSMAAIHQQFRSSGGGSGERPLPAPPASPRWSGVTVGQNENGGDPGAGHDNSEAGTDQADILVAPPESA
jgi:hypothetical protein